MLASKLIADLQEVVAMHGDYEVIDEHGREITVEFNDDSGPCVLVGFDD